MKVGDQIDLQQLIRQLEECRFYGSLTLKFEAGRIVILKKEQTLNPADLSGQPRRNNGTEEANHKTAR